MKSPTLILQIFPPINNSYLIKKCKIYKRDADYKFLQWLIYVSVLKLYVKLRSSSVILDPRTCRNSFFQFI